MVVQKWQDLYIPQERLQKKGFPMNHENSENHNEKSPYDLSFKRLYIEVRDEEIERAIDYLVSNT
jgi:hypothetical protein